MAAHEPKDTRVPALVETLGDLEKLVEQDPEDRRIDMRGLSKLREAKSATTMINALLSDHGWELVGGIYPVSNAAGLDQDLDSIEAVTLPRLELDIKGKDNQLKAIPDQRKAMKVLVEHVRGLKRPPFNFGPSLESTLDALINLVENLYNNLPITHTHINEIASRIQAIRDSPIRFKKAADKLTELIMMPNELLLGENEFVLGENEQVLVEDLRI